MRNVIERVLNLLAFLLTVGRPVTADEIRQTVAGYGDQSEDAFARMFARDKDLLRRMGVPLRLAPTDRWEVEQGYVIPPDEYRLPDPDLSDEERAALWLATQVVRIGGQPAGPEAILKLGGARTTQGVEPLAADLGSESELLAELYQATVDRRVVGFEYRQKRRTLFPHGIGHARGHWYLVGVDPAADGDTRVFRVDRITELDIGREPGSFTRTPDVDVRSALSEHPWETGEEIVEATVRFGPEAAWWARRRLGATGSFDAREDGIEDVTLDVSNAEAFIGWVLSFGEHAEILAPPELREALVRHVREVQV